MWRLKDSNQSPSESISDALPTELNPLKRQRQDLNLRGQSPVDFKSTTLTTRSRCPSI